MTRKLNVQTPGETPQTDQADADLITGDTQANDDTAPAGDTIEALQARVAELEGKVKSQDEEAAERLKADEKAMDEGGRMITRADRVKYLTMHSSQIDAKKLLAPVQCKDGWLAPDMSDRPARR